MKFAYRPSRGINFAQRPQKHKPCHPSPVLNKEEYPPLDSISGLVPFDGFSQMVGTNAGHFARTLTQ